MKLAIMQPYFFPYIGYFSLIKHTDQFILLDEVQYIKQGWIHRNKILKESTGWTYMRFPLLMKGYKTLIKDVAIDNRKNWKQKILAQLNVYKKVAPNFPEVVSVVEKLFEIEYNDIASLNKDSLTLVCEYLNIQNDIKIFSEMNLEIEKPKAPDEWALNICKAVGNVKEYWNPPGGLDFYDSDKYKRENIKLLFQKINTEYYAQRGDIFIPFLSILDVMMFNSIDRINKMLDNYELIGKT